MVPVHGVGHRRDPSCVARNTDARGTPEGPRPPPGCVRRQIRRPTLFGLRGKCPVTRSGKSPVRRSFFLSDQLNLVIYLPATLPSNTQHLPKVAVAAQPPGLGLVNVCEFKVFAPDCFGGSQKAAPQSDRLT